MGNKFGCLVQNNLPLNLQQRQQQQQTKRRLYSIFFAAGAAAAAATALFSLAFPGRQAIKKSSANSKQLGSVRLLLLLLLVIVITYTHTCLLSQARPHGQVINFPSFSFLGLEMWGGVKRVRERERERLHCPVFHVWLLLKNFEECFVPFLLLWCPLLKWLISFDLKGMRGWMDEMTSSDGSHIDDFNLRLARPRHCWLIPSDNAAAAGRLAIYLTLVATSWRPILSYLCRLPFLLFWNSELCHWTSLALSASWFLNDYLYCNFFFYFF